MTMRSAGWQVVLAGTLVYLLAACGAGEATSVVRVDPSKRYQIIQGWAATAEAGQEVLDETPSTRDAIADAAVDRVGIDRLRLEIRSGDENPVDSYRLFREGKISRQAYRDSRYDAVNDDDDPHHARPGGFHFSRLDDAMDQVVIPIRRRLEARGEHLYLNLCYVDFGASSFEQYENPEEYAELISVAFAHLKQRYGFVPDGVEVILEPDKAPGWSPDRVGAALVAASRRLASEGYRPEFIAPSTGDARHADTYQEALLRTPGVRPALRELSYHRYGIVLPGLLARLATRAIESGLRTSMLEKIGADIDTLDEDLRDGMVSAWQQYTVAYPGPDDGSHYLVLEGDPPRPRLSQTARLLSEVFRNVQPGDVRVGAEAEGADLDALAFAAPGGHVVVSVRSHGPARFDVRGLPAGRYVTELTTEKELAVESAPIDVGTGGVLHATMPAEGVLVLRDATLARGLREARAAQPAAAGSRRASPGP